MSHLDPLKVPTGTQKVGGKPKKSVGGSSNTNTKKREVQKGVKQDGDTGVGEEDGDDGMHMDVDSAGPNLDEWMADCMAEVSRAAESTGNSCNFSPPVPGERSSTALVTRSHLKSDTGYYKQLSDKPTAASVCHLH